MGNSNIPPSALRHPPPPPLRRSGSSPRSGIEDLGSNTVHALTTGEEEEGNTSSMKPRNRPYYSPSCQKGDSTSINSLPEEMLLEILVRVPAEDIHENSRLVCRRWYRIIHSDDFVQSHLQHTSPGLFLGKHDGAPTTFVTAAAEGGIEISKLSYPSRFDILLSSCNGLLLGIDTDRENTPCVVNLATKTRFDLPLLPDTLFGCNTGLNSFGIAYVAASMEYKVVASFCRDFQHLMFAQCAILTVGVDNTWRNVATQHLSPEARTLLPCTPKITEGFIHWASCSCGILSMNVETETITEIPAPLPPSEHRDKGCNYYYLSTGRDLSILIPCGDLLWDVWEIRGEIRECEKLAKKIDLRAHKRRLSEICSDIVWPVGWVKYPNVLAFLFDDNPCPCIAYNLNTDEIESFDLDSKTCLGHVAVEHRNSLGYLLHAYHFSRDHLSR